MNDDSRLLSALADPTRLHILRQLADCGAVCACDVAPGRELSQPTISHHLRVLREAGWVEAERRGTWIWYSLRPAAAQRLRAIADSLSPPDAAGPAGYRRLPVLQSDGGSVSAN